MGKYKFIEERVETMSSSELKIFLNILKSRSKELMSTLESVRGIKDLEAVCKSTQKLNNRVSEFDGGSFLIFIIRKSKFPQNPKRSVRFSGKGTKRSVQKRKARNTQKAETKVL